MPIVTLTSDLGKDTHLVAKAKMQLLEKLPQATIIDISHSVAPFAIDEAVYLAASCINDFPQGTLHLIAVDMDVEKYGRLLACQFKGQLFVAADNGFLALLTKGEEATYYEIPFEADENSNFAPLKYILIPTAIQLIQKGLEAIGKPVNDILEKTLERPFVMAGKSLRGHIVYVNNYGNAVTNITRDMFDTERAGRNFEIVLNRFDSINTISTSYNTVEEGDCLCFFNENGWLEIAVNRGEASQLLGLEKGKRITIDFFDAQATQTTVKTGGLFIN